MQVATYMRDTSVISSAEIQKIVSTHTNLEGPLLPILHALQDRFGYIPNESFSIITSALSITAADLKGVISFYHYFKTTPPANNVVQICRAEACQALGARSLETHAKNRLGIGYHEMTADKEFGLEPVYCLGNCGCGPAVRVGDQIVGRVTAERFDELLSELQTKAVEIQ